MVLAAGQHGPGDACQFIGDCHHALVVGSTLRQPPLPLPKSCSVVLHAEQYCASTVDQHATQINVAALAMPYSFCLPPVEYCRGTTPTQAAKSRPRRKAASLPIAATVAVETSGPKPGMGADIVMESITLIDLGSANPQWVKSSSNVRSPAEEEAMVRPERAIVELKTAEMIFEFPVVSKNKIGTAA